MNVLPYYNTCPNCGANLDPGEHCDCQRELAADTDDNMKGTKTA